MGARKYHRYERIGASGKGFDQSLRCLQISRLKAFLELTIDWRESVPSFNELPLSLVQPSKTDGRPQLPGERVLLTGALERATKLFLGFSHRSRSVLEAQKLTLDS